MKPDEPKGWTWVDMGWNHPPQSVPREVDGPLAWRETVLVDRYGRPLVVRQPRRAGFRPERAR